MARLTYISIFALIIPAILQFGLPAQVHAAPVSYCKPGVTAFIAGNQCGVFDSKEEAIAQGYTRESSYLLDGTVTAPKPVSCASTVDKMSNPFVCLGRFITSFTGSILISISAWLLGMIGLVLNWLIDMSVVDFTAQVWGKVGPGVETSWTFFRDLANIGIIGLFTFIAISIILGLQQFGQKKLIARVLIIALLINFSLLFTKVVVNTSNFVAKAFYCASLGKTAAACGAAASSSAGNASTIGGVNTSATGIGDSIVYAKDGLAGQFIKYMALATIGDSYNSLKALADKSDNGWVALLHGVVASILLLLAAATFLFGVVLLFARLVLLIFLMSISAFAFTAYLIPGLDNKFRLWWETLIRTAFFAPLLLMFFWMTLKISEVLYISKGSLGSLLSPDPSLAVSAGIPTLVNYFIVIGLLIASIRFSASFSKQIAGMSLATGVSIGGASWLTGAALRNTYGRLNASRAERRGADIENEKARIAAERIRKPGVNPDLKPLARMIGDKKKLEDRSKGVYNPLGTAAGKEFASSLGMSPALQKAFGGGKSFVDITKSRAEEAAKMAAGTVASQDAAEKLVKSGREEAHKAIADEHARNEDVVKKVAAAATSAVSSRGLPEKKSAAESAMKEAQKDLQKKLGEIGEKLESAVRTGSPATVERVKAEHQEALRAGNARITSAKDEAARISAEMEKVRNEEVHPIRMDDGSAFVSSGNEAKKNLTESTKSIKEAAQALVTASKEAAPVIAATQARGTFAKIFDYDDAAAAAARKQAKQKVGDADKIKAMKERNRLRKAAEDPAPAPAPKVDAPKPAEPKH